MKIFWISFIITIIILAIFVVTSEIFSKNVGLIGDDITNEVKQFLFYYKLEKFAEQLGRNQDFPDDFFTNHNLDVYLNERSPLSNVDGFDLLYHNCSLESCEVIVLDQSKNLSEQTNLGGIGYLYTGQKEGQSVILKIPFDLPEDSNLFLNISRDIEFFQEYEAKFFYLLENSSVHFPFLELPFTTRVKQYFDGSFNSAFSDYLSTWHQDTSRAFIIKDILENMAQVDIEVSEISYYYNRLESLMPEFSSASIRVQSRPFESTIGGSIGMLSPKTPLEKAKESFSKKLFPSPFSGSLYNSDLYGNHFLEMIQDAYDGYSSLESPESRYLRLKTIYTLVFQKVLDYCKVGEEFCILEFTDCGSHNQCLIKFIIAEGDSSMCQGLSYGATFDCRRFFSAASQSDCSAIGNEIVREACYDKHSDIW